MNRRSFLSAGLTVSLLAPLSGFSQQTSPGLRASPTDIVLLELANFYCSRCRAVNDHYDRLKSSARSAGLDFRFAPVAWEGQSVWPDRVYYAMRDVFPGAEGLVREAMFDGIQREGQRFETMSQVFAYLQRRQLVEKAKGLGISVNLADVADKANSDDVMFAEMKAGRLLNMTGAEEVPVFMWIKDGEVLKVISPNDNPEPVGLVQLVNKSLLNRDY